MAEMLSARPIKNRLGRRSPRQALHFDRPQLAGTSNFRAAPWTLREADDAMNLTLLKALLAMVPVSVLSFGSVILFRKGKTLGSFLQMVGAGCLLIVVVLSHFCEALHLLAWMRWGDRHSVGHYLDLGSAVLGFILFPVGYLFHAVSERK